MEGREDVGRAKESRCFGPETQLVLFPAFYYETINWIYVVALGDASLTRVDAGLQCGQTDWIRRTQRTTPTFKLGPGFSRWRGSA